MQVSMPEAVLSIELQMKYSHQQLPLHQDLAESNAEIESS